MSQSVYRQFPDILAGAHIGHSRGHSDGLGQRLPGHDDPGRDNHFRRSTDVLRCEKGEAVATASDAFDIGQARNKDIWHAEGFQQLPSLVHNFPLSAPREDRPLRACASDEASGSADRYTHVGRDGLSSVNALVATPRNGPSQIGYQPTGNNGRHGSAHHNAALGLFVGGDLQINPPNDADNGVSDFEMQALNVVALDDFGFGQRRRDNLTRHQSSPFSGVSA